MPICELSAQTGVTPTVGAVRYLAGLNAGRPSQIGRWLVLAWRVEGWVGTRALLLPPLGTG